MDQKPASAEEFMLTLKLFSNILHALFTCKCPLYQQMYGIIKALRGYSPSTRKQLLHEVKIVILWIILLQSRRFSQGKMVGDYACLGEFTKVGNQIKAKNCGAICNTEAP